MIYAFDEFELDTSRNTLRRAGSELKVEPRVLAVLKYLVDHHDRVVSKDELLGKVWHGEVVSEAVLPVSVGKLRRVLGQQRGERLPIDTDHGIGYRFASDVRVRSRAGESQSWSLPARAQGPIAEPLIGREAIVQRLWSALQQAQAGQMRLMLLEGEAGIGKSRLAQELSLIAERQGTSVWFARCLEQQGAPAFWPWLSVLRQAVSELSPEALRKLGGRTLERLAPLLPELFDLLERAPGRTETPAQEDKFVLFDTIARVLQVACAGSPHLLVLDDLHWADPASLELTHFLGSQLGRARLLIVGTLRKGAFAFGGQAADNLQSLLRSRVCERVELSALTRDEVARYVDALIDDEPDGELLDALYRSTGGNPFFVREALRLMTDGTRALPQRGTISVPLPDQVRDLVRSRLAGLEGESLRVLSLAAVIGSRFDVPLLERVAGLPGTRLLAALEPAVRLQLCAPDAQNPGSYRFAHELFRETLYQDVGVAERVAHHGAIAEVLEAASFGRDVLERLSEISLHFHRALPGGHAQKAFAHSLEAATTAMNSYAFEDAAMLYARALEADDYAAAQGHGVDDAQRCEVLILLSHAYAAAFRFHDAFAAAQRAIDIARVTRQPELLARAVLERPHALLRIERGELAQADEALAALPPEERPLRARLLCRVAGTMRADMPLRRRALAQAAALVAQTGNRTARLELLVAQVLIPHGPGELAALLDASTTLADFAADMQRPDLAFLARRSLWIAHLRKGEGRAAAADIDACESALQSYPHPIAAWNLQLIHLQQALMQGRLAEVEAQWSELLPDKRRKDGIAVLVSVLVLHALLREQGFVVPAEGLAAAPLQRGEFRTVLGELARNGIYDRARALALIDAGGPLMLRTLEDSASRAGSALFLLEVGRVAAAREAFAEVARALDAGAAEALPLVLLSYLAQLAARLGDDARARQVYERLLPYAGQHVCDDLGFYGGAVALQLGTLARRLGQAERAAEHFESALTLHEALGARPALIRTRLALGELLLEQGPARRRSGLAQLDQVAAEAKALGMQGVARHAESLKR